MKKQLVIKEYQGEGIETCELCGEEIEYQTPSAIFIEGTESVVCIECTRKLDPELVEVFESRYVEEVED